ncbi:LysE/ArgO family amino acid transporter [Amylibacter sp. IMCC11727]|uniref:LysE/ArgO family amino acid transporter n=1 Tax=Amylibacter sp. IMCC11727 TaxID=3039851 RepID=UPI00244E4038|nr:LysE/ArgO family amino acid transporter [Amylibacter sp. IMCC11727]WGI20375.1 LysE/ArgO family amino acid transporter [Amylibacter sp. IMCC11727]
MIGAATTGFFTGFSLILAIGAQNAFILRQGLLRSHVFPLALFCAVSDAILITAGVAGFGVVVERIPSLPLIMSLAGAAFLFVYGGLRFWAAWGGEYAMELSGESMGLRAALGVVFAFTWLNPHVYLDTLALIGAVSTQYQGDEKIAFGAAAVLASFVFFFGLGYGARILAPIMQTPFTWRVLDVIIGCVMWMIAVGLVLSLGAH